MVTQDWNYPGYFAACLVDLGQGKITVVYKVANADLPAFMFYQTYHGRINVGNPPPPPPPIGDKGLARFMLESELLITNVAKDAATNANACPP